MNDTAKPGDWARIHIVILEAQERAPGIPADTACHRYEGWIKGWAVEEARVGEPVTVRTMAGRHVRGRLSEVHPGYHHGFGRPHPALLAVGPALRRLLDERRE